MPPQMKIGDTVDIPMPTGTMPTVNTQTPLATLPAGDYLLTMTTRVTYTDPADRAAEQVRVQADVQIESLNDPSFDGFSSALGGLAYTTTPGSVHVQDMMDQATLTLATDMQLATTRVGRVDRQDDLSLVAPVTVLNCTLVAQRVRLTG